MKRLIACEAALWDVPGGATTAFAVASCESRFQTAAYNPTGCGGSGCSGLFQQSLRGARSGRIQIGQGDDGGDQMQHVMRRPCDHQIPGADAAP